MFVAWLISTVGLLLQSYMNAKLQHQMIEATTVIEHANNRLKNDQELIRLLADQCPLTAATSPDRRKCGQECR